MTAQTDHRRRSLSGAIEQNSHHDIDWKIGFQSESSGFNAEIGIVPNEVCFDCRSGERKKLIPATTSSWSRKPSASINCIKLPESRPA